MTGCRFCGAELTQCVVDLGLSPISNHFRGAGELNTSGQTFYPLKVMVCSSCWLVQLTDIATPEHFDDNYVYFSSNSSSWLAHAEIYANRMIDMLALSSQATVVEIASNDGYLLQYFKRAGIDVLGIEPTSNTAAYARREHGIESVVEFFSTRLGKSLAEEGVSADLVVANNVLAHVPNPNDFLGGIPHLLKPDGTITFEFPHLLRLLEQCQFDTIYHEHFSYLSLGAVERMLERHGLKVYGVEELGTHGGSLRVYACHRDHEAGSVELGRGRTKVRKDEADAGLETFEAYTKFADAVANLKCETLRFLIDAKGEGKKVLGYGAPAKGNTFLNYCGIGPELLAFTVDVSPAKQHQFLPGVNIEVRAPESLEAERPDYVLILPWNLRKEISAQLVPLSSAGTKFVTAIPELEIF